jgi:signal transduction histidine kinase
MDIPARSLVNRRGHVRRETDRSFLKRDRELRAVRHITEALFQHMEVDELIVQALETAVALVNAESGSILIADPGTKRLVFRHSIGTCPVAPGTAIPWDHGIAGHVFCSGKLTLIENAQADPRHCTTIDTATGHVTRDLMALPLKRWQGEAIGVLEVLNKRDGVLNEEDIEILTIVSAIAAMSIEQARLFQKAKLAEVALMLGNISHDIGNLLMPVLCGASMLKTKAQDVLSDEQGLEHQEHRANYALCIEVADIIDRSSQRIQDRVKEIADCVKGRSTVPHFALCRLDQILTSVFATLKGMAAKNGVTLLQEELDGLPAVIADEQRLFSAFYNLVHNALAEVPAGGSITVSGTQQGDSIHLTVTDTGRGMPPDVLDSLFTNSVKSGKPRGTGLGIRIVKDVVDNHGGLIRVNSRVGMGTTFAIVLPISQTLPGSQ